MRPLENRLTFYDKISNISMESIIQT